MDLNEQFPDEEYYIQRATEDSKRVTIEASVKYDKIETGLAMVRGLLKQNQPRRDEGQPFVPLKQVPVEKKLNDKASQYQLRKSALKEEQEVIQKFEDQVERIPTINKVSSIMAAQIQPKGQKVEDRLLENHRRIQSKKEYQQQQVHREAKILSQPSVMSAYSIITDTMSLKDSVNRLHGEQLSRIEKKEFLHQKYDEVLNTCTFTPNINQNYQGNGNIKMQYQVKSNEELTFIPKINKMSEKIVSLKDNDENVAERLYKLHQEKLDKIEQKNNNNENSFKPELNPISEAMASKEQNRSNRWDKLYKLARIQELIKKEKRAENLYQEEQNVELTFKPELVSKQSYQNKTVQERTMEWKLQKDRKQEVTIIEKEMENDDNLTFKPFLISQQSNSLNNSSVVESIPSADKFIDRLHQARVEKQKDMFQEENYIGSGKNWKNQLTIPRAPRLSNRVRVDLFDKQTIKSLTKVTGSSMNEQQLTSLIRNYKNSEVQNKLEESSSQILLHNKQRQQETQFTSQMTIQDCIASLHNEIQGIDI